MRYVVSNESGFAEFRWPWAARAAFKALPIQHGESKALMRFGRKGKLKVLAADDAEPLSPSDEVEDNPASPAGPANSGD